ncbi:ComF family protein [Alteromonas aestuariivivens]|uniref:ComF family protein n=1 Tax=Alteromonas aestuariivivens TaxID=1938339 RepID=A0A3D8M5G5_9ALTE|nr:phosphoribosyltransferase family protein [Alteromonas aestuariivivens]RDV24848.1 ComF family protein [Alteromonas aestuariivivens]
MAKAQKLFTLLRNKANLSCCLCHQSSGSWVCRFCQDDTLFYADSSWPCNLLLRPEIARHVEHSAYDSLQSCGWYTWPFDELICSLKFNRRSLCATVLADWFCQFALQTDTPLPQCLLPVPIHYRRYMSRHFNQSTEIALWLSRLLGIAVNTQWARRIRGRDQHSLGRQQRLLNLRQAFRATPVFDYQHVAIVDDVITTGSTVNELARQLKQANPKLHISVWAMAVTPAKAGLAR